MRAVHSLFFLAALSACAPVVPDSASGIGFDTSPQARAALDQELSGTTITGQPLVPPTAISDESRPLGTAPTVGAPLPLPAGARQPVATTIGDPAAADIAAQTAAALGGSVASAGQGAANPTPAPLNNPGLSDENDFGAVSGRQTIQSDAERIAQNRQQYQVIAPTELPTRPGGAQATVVTFALSTSHPVGTRVYSRSGINLAARAERKCRAYGSADQAQTAFLGAGGPERDRLGLDPDGDGYACDWNPAPFRQAVKN